MIVVRFLGNALIMAAELAAVIAVAWLAYRHPFVFALVTALLALLLGLALEVQRLRHELPFYFEQAGPRPGLVLIFTTLAETVLKAGLAGLVALLTFSGTDPDRLFWEAVVFGVCVYGASNVLGSLAWRAGVKPLRWGYFRLAAPLGLLFSIGISSLVAFAVLRTPTLAELLQKGLLETAQRPTVEQASELFYLVKMWFDGVVVAMLATLVGPQWAPALGVALSVNVLAGFVIAIYAVVIAEAALRAERRLP